MLNLLLKPCKVCGDRKPHDGGVIRLNTAQGMHEIEVCQQCAEFFDKSADVILKGKVERDPLGDE